ncbi:enolase 4 [Engraulis encrasicolus]|uniref:enolase 4 n=1 Tax=Engraulis encrasicolus TaxID=184585 RepID=UPI002FCF810E
MSFKGMRGCNSRVSKEDQEFYDLKCRAAEYYRANLVPQRIEGVLNQMFLEKPGDIYGYLANYFSQHSAKASFCRLEGKELYDGHGHLSAQANVYCTIRNEVKWVCGATVPSYSERASVGGEQCEAAGENPTHRRALETALSWINQPISNMLQGLQPSDQAAIDKILSDFFLARFAEFEDERKTREREREEEESSIPSEVAPPVPPPSQAKDNKKGKKSMSAERTLPPEDPPVPVMPGCCALGATSLALAKSGAAVQGVPLYQHIRALRAEQVAGDVHMPFPMVPVLSCGKASPGKLNLLDEVLVIPAAANTLRQKITTVVHLQKEVERILNMSSRTGSMVFPVTEAGAMVVAFDRMEQPLDLLMEACCNLQLTPGTDLYFALHCSAHRLMDYSKGKYEVVMGTMKSPDELVELYESLVSKYPGIAALIDPFRKEDAEQWDKLNYGLTGHACVLIADAGFGFCPRNYGNEKLPFGVAGVVLKHVNETTISDLLHTTSGEQGAAIILEQSGSLSYDDYPADLAVGLGVKLVRLGGVRGGVHMGRYNRLLAVEEELAKQGILGSNRLALPLFPIPDRPVTPDSTETTE